MCADLRETNQRNGDRQGQDEASSSHVRSLLIKVQLLASDPNHGFCEIDHRDSFDLSFA
jgi:hypothetical protein